MGCKEAAVASSSEHVIDFSVDEIYPVYTREMLENSIPYPFRIIFSEWNRIGILFFEMLQYKSTS
jgi:hypothetical protein